MGRGPSKKDADRIHLLLTKALTRKIDDFRYRRRFPTRTGAIEYLLVWALKQNPPREERE